ncbi:recombinase family protein [Marinobacter salexigens]|uniref:Recombinase family protein n=1 Tax=Marinobacter salexigens TaxID=1925763 RepID=A0ABS6A7A1_9GAMM|nr:recombinase family protein [Marinobacter salexigens]MBU2873842.1 recombinase family protein [Marinobacter salexigens]
MEFIYRRVSTAEQKTDRQLPGMNVDREYEDKLSGKDLNRPQLTAMLQNLREGDLVHVHELSRLGRSVRDLLDVVQQVVDTGAT